MRKIALIFFFIQSLVFSISSQETIKPYQFGIHVAPKRRHIAFKMLIKVKVKVSLVLKLG